MTDIVALLVKQQPVSERQLSRWIRAIDQNMLYISTGMIVNLILPAWKSLGDSVRNREDLEARQGYHQLKSWLLPVPDSIHHAVVLLTNDENLSCAVLLTAEYRRAESVNQIAHILPLPSSSEVTQAILWIGRLLMRRVFYIFDATPKPIEEAWICAATIMHYILLRLVECLPRESAGAMVLAVGETKFVEQLREAAENNALLLKNSTLNA